MKTKRMPASEVVQWNHARYEVELAVHCERVEQLKKWGVKNHPPEVWLPILNKQVGHLSAAILDRHFDNTGMMSGRDCIKKQAIQVAAVASALAQWCNQGKA